MSLKVDDLVTYAAAEDLQEPTAIVYSIKNDKAILVNLRSKKLIRNVPLDKLILTPDQSESTKLRYGKAVGGGPTLRRSKKRKSTRRKSTRRKSIKRKSTKRKSMKRKNTRRRTMKIRKSKLQGGSPKVSPLDEMIAGFKKSKTDAGHEYVSEYVSKFMNQSEEQVLSYILKELDDMYGRLKEGGKIDSYNLREAGVSDGVNKDDVKTIFNSILVALKGYQVKDSYSGLSYYLTRNPLP